MSARRSKGACASCWWGGSFGGALAKEVGDRNLAAVSTTELKARRAEVLKQYGEIQRDVEFKAGLPMGVAIKDDRALLGELYREAHD